jgi:hypothetical protein
MGRPASGTALVLTTTTTHTRTGELTVKTFESPTPTRLRAAKVAMAATAITASAALTAAAITSTVDRSPTSDPAAVASSTLPQIQADVELAAVVGFYGVGPLFQVASLAGATPSAVLAGLAGLTGNTALADTITRLDGLIHAIDAVSPVSEGVAAPGPSGVYNSVTGLEYSSSYLARLLNIDPKNPVYRQVTNLVGPIGGQRRAYILSEGLGGTSTAIALNDMITAVQTGDPNWEASGNPGVTGVVAFMIRNPSRPGGGFLALFTPTTEPLGVNLSNPDLSGKSGGSYISPDKKQILNIGITDVAFKYDLMSDAPSTIDNPVSWLNSLVGFVLPTYLIPKEENIGYAVNSVVPGSFGGLGNAILVTADPTGGQGVRVVPVIGPLLDALGQQKLLDATKIPGRATYITYDSGNLPLLEPFTVVQRLLGYLPGVNIPTPIADALQPALQQLVDVGYQDVQLTYKNGVPTFSRTMDMGGTQAIAVNSPISAEQSLQLPQAVTNALVRGIEDSLLTPHGAGLQVGLSLQPLLLGNPLAVALESALKAALTVSMAVVNPMFDASEQLLSPVAQVADLGLPKTPRAAAAASQSASSSRAVMAPSASALASSPDLSTAPAATPGVGKAAVVSAVRDVVPEAPNTIVNPNSSAPSVSAPVQTLLPPAVRDVVLPTIPAPSQVGAAMRDTVRDAVKSAVSDAAAGAPAPAASPDRKLGRGAVRDAIKSAVNSVVKAPR